MKANELRIGNLVNCTNHKHIQFFEIEMFYGLSDFKPKLEYEDLTISFHTCKPIPLTEEWLLKFGFENNSFDNFCYLHFNPRMAIRFLNFNSAECEIIQDDKYISFKWKHIEYVHQLQNLYFALTGKDLSMYS